MIVDVVDDKNRVVGVAERKSLFDDKLNFRTVHILLFDRLNRLVLQQLPSNHPRNPNRLGSSVAGYLNRHENYAQAAKRKLKQELHITAQLKDIGQLEMLDNASHKFIEIFVGRLRARPKFERDEINELIYMYPEDVSALLKTSPEKFTPTFQRVYEYYRRQQKED